jgi:hypothetical protein
MTYKTKEVYVAGYLCNIAIDSEFECSEDAKASERLLIITWKFADNCPNENYESDVEQQKFKTFDDRLLILEKQNVLNYGFSTEEQLSNVGYKEYRYVTKNYEVTLQAIEGILVPELPISFYVHFDCEVMELWRIKKYLASQT